MDTSVKILAVREGRILRVTLNRPDKKNAIDHDMYRGLTKALRDAASDPDIHVVILQGSGDSFTAGNDLKSFLASPAVSDDAPAPEFLRTLARFPKIIVAAVHGFAVGIGTTMLLHCDIVIASMDAKFQLPFINLGLVPEAASSLLLPARIGHARAAELLLLGDMFDAHAAHQLGLVNRVVARGDLEAEANGFAARIGEKPAFALIETKKLLKAAADDIDRHMNAEFKSFAACLGRDDFKQAAESFFKPKG